MAHTKWSEIKRRKGVTDVDVAVGQAALRAALALRDLRTSRGMTQVELASLMQTGQGNVSEIERRQDLFLSTLREYVHALGGELELAAVFDGERVPITIGKRGDAVQV